MIPNVADVVGLQYWITVCAALDVCKWRIIFNILTGHYTTTWCGMSSKWCHLTCQSLSKMLRRNFLKFCQVLCNWFHFIFTVLFWLLLDIIKVRVLYFHSHFCRTNLNMFVGCSSKSYSLLINLLTWQFSVQCVLPMVLLLSFMTRCYHAGERFDSMQIFDRTSAGWLASVRSRLPTIRFRPNSKRWHLAHFYSRIF